MNKHEKNIIKKPTLDQIFEIEDWVRKEYIKIK